MTDLPRTHRPLWVGALVAPWAGPTAFLLYATFDSLAGHGPVDVGLWALMALVYYVFGLPVSYATMFVLGLPYVLWLRKHHQLGWLQICAGASVAGSVVFSVAWVAAYQLYKPLLVFASLGAGLGLASGIVFCVVVWPSSSFKPDPPAGER